MARVPAFHSKNPHIPLQRRRHHDILAPGPTSAGCPTWGLRNLSSVSDLVCALDPKLAEKLGLLRRQRRGKAAAATPRTREDERAFADGVGGLTLDD
jgi:hypothetical protein